MSIMKVGASKKDQAKIIKYTEAGYNASQISQMLFIRPEIVERFTPEKQGKSKAKVKAINDAANKKHGEVMDRKNGKVAAKG